MDGLSSFFLGWFIFGLVFTLASFLFGGLGGRAGRHLAWQWAYKNRNWLNFHALIVFITWFGGSGFVFQALGFPEILALTLAVVAGLTGYVYILAFFNKTLYSTFSSPGFSERRDDLTGTVAIVVQPVDEKGQGRVMYAREGNRRVIPAVNLDGERYPLEARVVITGLEGGIARVQDLNKLLVEAGGEKWASRKLELHKD